MKLCHSDVKLWESDCYGTVFAEFVETRSVPRKLPFWEDVGWASNSMLVSRDKSVWPRVDGTQRPSSQEYHALEASGHLYSYREK